MNSLITWEAPYFKTISSSSSSFSSLFGSWLVPVVVAAAAAGSLILLGLVTATSGRLVWLSTIGLTLVALILIYCKSDFLVLV